MIKTTLLILALFTVGCVVSEEDWKEASAACAQNQGIRFYYVTPTSNIVCNNGAKFLPSEAKAIYK